MLLKGFIFDLDGVIVDTAKYHYLAWRKMANELGFDITEDQNEKLKGVSREASLKLILSWGNVALEAVDFKRLMAEKNENYLSFIAGMTSGNILPDVPKVLEWLKEKTYPVALGSASKNARSILDITAARHFFDAIVDGNDVKEAKPDPEVFLEAAKQLNVVANNCIVFEDSVAGVTAANAAGMISIGIGNKDVLGHADYVFKDFTKIGIGFLEELVTIEK